MFVHYLISISPTAKPIKIIDISTEMESATATPSSHDATKNLAPMKQVQSPADGANDKKSMVTVSAKTEADGDEDVKRYSNGITFKKHCLVQLIPCDQLNSLASTKRRISQGDEHRNWVLRKLFTIGGYVRSIDIETYTEIPQSDTRFYVPPNTKIPDCIQPSQIKHKKHYLLPKMNFWKKSRVVPPAKSAAC